MDLVIVFGCGESEARSLAICMCSLVLSFFSQVRKRLHKLVLSPIDRVPLLEEGIDVIFLGFSGGVLLDVDGVLEDFGVVHGAPADETAVVGEGGELVLLDVAMNSLLDVEVLAHRLYNFNKYIGR